MTRVPVTDVSQLMPYAVDTVSKVQTGGSGFGDSLKAAMSSRDYGSDAGSKADVKEAEKETPDYSARTEKKPVDDNHKVENKKTENPKAKDDNVTKGTETDTEEIPEEVVNEVAQTVVQIVGEIAEVMDVTETEVVQAIDELGLNMNDLLDASKLADIITKLSGNEDAVSLLTDENLYSKLGELQEFVSDSKQNLINELDLSQEALNEILDRSEVPVETKSLAELGMSEENMLQKPEAAIEGMKDYKVTTFVDGKEITTDVKVDDNTGAQTANVQITAQSTEEEKGNPSNENGEGRKHSDADPEHVQAFSQELQKNNEINVPEGPGFEGSFVSEESEASRIANQIMENMKINLKSDMTSLEMNLHPASLGSVRVNLTSQNGQISAQFIAQNETVRAAIESQVVQLTNQLEDQGIKVESVEVAVADHKFEHEGGDEAGQNNSNDKSGKPKAGRIRRIDMSALDEDADLDALEDADRIAAQMMAHEGNKVDYTA